MRWPLGIVIAFAVSLVAGALAGPSPAGSHMRTGTAHAHPADAHPQSPGDSHPEGKSASDCCMLACVPVILNASAPALAPLRLAGRIAPASVRYMAASRVEPPFHPPQTG